MAIDVAQFRREQQIQVTASCSEITAALNALRGLDKFSEKKQSLWGMIATIAFTLGVVVGLVACAIAAEPVTIGVSIGFIIIGIIAVERGSHYSQGNVEDRRYELIARLLPLLETDMHPDAQLDLQLNLQGTETHGNLDRTDDLGKITEKHYVDPWLKLSGRFLDGTSFQVGFLEKLRVRRIEKYSASGKYKPKTKRKHKVSISVQLKVKPHRYPALQSAAANMGGAIQLPPGSEATRVKIDGPILSMRAIPDPYWDAAPPGEVESESSGANIIAMMFLSLYQVLNLAKTLQKGQASETQLGA